MAHDQTKLGPRLVIITILTSALLTTLLLGSVPVAAQSDGFFDSPHSDFGYDGDADNRFEYLQVDTRINVTQIGDFTVEGILKDLGGSTIITSNGTLLSAGSTGIHIVGIVFNGSHIFESDIDGPYRVELSLLNDTSVEVDADVYATGAYSHLDFGPPIAFTPPHSDWGIDTDSNGKYNFIQVNVSANTSQPGYYTLFSILYKDFGVIGMKIRLYNLTAGDHILSVNFSGIGAYISGEDGPYSVQLYAAGLIFGGPGEFSDQDTYMTGGYFFTDFEPGTKRNLKVNVTNSLTAQPVTNETVWLANKTHGWAIQMTTDDNGTANFTAFEGDFVLMAQGEDDGLQGVTQPLTVTGNVVVDVGLGEVPPSDGTITLTMTSWDTVDLDFLGLMPEGNQTQRFMIDQFVGLLSIDH